MKKISKATIVKRIKHGKKICPICGCNRFKLENYNVYPEVEYYVSCKNCNVLLEYAVNSPEYSVFDFIKNLDHISYKSCSKVVELINEHA